MLDRIDVFDLINLVANRFFVAWKETFISKERLLEPLKVTFWITIEIVNSRWPTLVKQLKNLKEILATLNVRSQSLSPPKKDRKKAEPSRFHCIDGKILLTQISNTDAIEKEGDFTWGWNAQNKTKTYSFQ